MPGGGQSRDTDSPDATRSNRLRCAHRTSLIVIRESVMYVSRTRPKDPKSRMRGQRLVCAVGGRRSRPKQSVRTEVVNSHIDHGTPENLDDKFGAAVNLRDQPSRRGRRGVLLTLLFVRPSVLRRGLARSLKRPQTSLDPRMFLTLPFCNRWPAEVFLPGETIASLGGKERERTPARPP